MFSIEVPINIVWLLFVPPLFIYLGYKMRTGAIRRRDEQAEELEKEIMNSHSEILDLQKQVAELESRIQELKAGTQSGIPVIPIKSNLSSDQEQDISTRKKLLLKEAHKTSTAANQ